MSALGWPASALADSWQVGPPSLQKHPAGVSAELANGSVLLAGGDDTNSPQGELLPANTGPFAPAGPMTQERIFAAGTLLHNGDVLIAGGDDMANETTPVPKTAELWSPQGGGMFTPTGPMNVSRQVFTLTTLPTGQALAVGGSPDLLGPGATAGSATTELYNPVTGKWTRSGSMPSGRLGHTATLLPDCRVLIVGDASHAVTYNYVTGKFAVVGSEGKFQRSYHTATLLANGEVLIAGGETRSQAALNTASVWDPATGQFKPTANDMSSPHSQGFAARLPDGRVIVGGGFSKSTPPTVPTDSVDIYNPATNKWSPAASLPPGSDAVSPEVEVLQDGDVVVMGIGQFGNGTAIYHPGPVGRTVSPPAQNCANLTHPFVVRSVRVGSRHVLKVAVSVPESGRLAVIATAQRWKTSSPKRWFGFGSARLNVSHAGGPTLSVFPSTRARMLLAHHHTLRVRVTTAYQPTVGPGKSTTLTIGISGH